MTLLEAWVTAHEMIITQHPIDQYLQRSAHMDGPPALSAAELIRAEFVLGWNLGRHVEILDGGLPRLVAGWTTEPLVSLIKPRSSIEPPVVLTVLTQRMYEQSVASGRYVVERECTPSEPPAVLDLAKERDDLRAQLGEPRAWLKKFRAATRAESNAHALALVRARFNATEKL